MATEVTFVPPDALADPPAAIATAPAATATAANPVPRRLDVRCIWIAPPVLEMSAPARQWARRTPGALDTPSEPCLLLAVDNRQGGYYGAHGSPARARPARRPPRPRRRRDAAAGGPPRGGRGARGRGRDDRGARLLGWRR